MSINAMFIVAGAPAHVYTSTYAEIYGVFRADRPCTLHYSSSRIIPPRNCLLTAVYNQYETHSEHTLYTYTCTYVWTRVTPGLARAFSNGLAIRGFKWPVGREEQEMDTCWKIKRSFRSHELFLRNARRKSVLRAPRTVTRENDARDDRGGEKKGLIAIARCIARIFSRWYLLRSWYLSLSSKGTPPIIQGCIRDIQDGSLTRGQTLEACRCTAPKTSQEGQLRSFKSYADVTIFHYVVPREVLRATWQFAAFMDDPACQPRKVYIHLRFGSYPIISTYNETFLIDASYRTTEHNRDVVVTAMTAYQSNNATVVPIYGPQAGDWFAGAYMSPWDERVRQQGLGHRCQYGIGTVALWSQVDSIENIPVGYEKTLQTSATTTYYKIYIPSGTWSFRLSVRNCSFTLHTHHDIFRELCIESMSLKGRSLPIPPSRNSDSLHEESISLSTHADHTFVESSPYEDSYYYLSIVSSSVIKFNVKVDLSECPVRMTVKSFAREYINTALSYNYVTGSSAKDLIGHEQYYDRNNISEFYSDKDNFYQHREKRLDRRKNEKSEDSCIPRHQLVRVKHSTAFSTVYLLQGEEWLSARLMLTDSVPLIMQFNILPLIDIGGTLDISMQLETKKLPGKVTVLVTVCVQKGRIPKLIENRSCPNGTLQMNLSSLDKHKHNASLLIPYPQPDTWYIITYMLCYYYGKPVHCELEEISVLLNVRTKRCVFSDPDPCGVHGICREIQKNGLHYATCSCFEDYAGWGCTNTLSVIAPYSSFMSAVMLTLSNVFFIPAIYIAIKRKLYAEGLVYFATMMFSSFYHACDQNGQQFCIAKYEVLQYIDFFSSILAFWITLIAMAKLPNNFIPLCHIMGVFMITVGVQINKTYLISILIPLSIGIIILILSYVYRNLRSEKCEKPSGRVFVGFLFTIIGLSLYSFVETEGNYRYVHSVWHIIMATSLIFLLPSKQTTSLSRRVSSDFDSKL